MELLADQTCPHSDHKGMPYHNLVDRGSAGGAIFSFKKNIVFKYIYFCYKLLQESPTPSAPSRTEEER